SGRAFFMQPTRTANLKNLSWKIIGLHEMAEQPAPGLDGLPSRNNQVQNRKAAGRKAPITPISGSACVVLICQLIQQGVEARIVADQQQRLVRVTRARGQ